VKNIFCVYGVNMPTEVQYCYKMKPVKVGEQPEGCRVIFDTDADKHMTDKQKINDYEFRDGIFWETPNTKQPNGKKICGDGTVPYTSLSYCETFKNDKQKNVVLQEIVGADHRSILKNEQLLQVLLDCAAGSLS